MNNLRNKIIAEIMKLVQPEMVKLDKKPTVAELEAILNSEDPPDIHLNPDGSISQRPKRVTTVGDVADAIIRLLKANGIEIVGEDFDKIIAHKDSPPNPSPGVKLANERLTEHLKTQGTEKGKP